MYEAYTQARRLPNVLTEVRRPRSTPSQSDNDVLSACPPVPRSPWRSSLDRAARIDTVRVVISKANSCMHAFQTHEALQPQKPRLVELLLDILRIESQFAPLDHLSGFVVVFLVHPRAFPDDVQEGVVRWFEGFDVAGFAPEDDADEVGLEVEDARGEVFGGVGGH